MGEEEGDGCAAVCVRYGWMCRDGWWLGAAWTVLSMGGGEALLIRVEGRTAWGVRADILLVLHYILLLS